jgi:hypothetical protein
VTTSASNTDSFSFLSEDDLPEWLRALGDDELSVPQPESRAVATQIAEPAPAAVVPAVSRAWLSRPRSVDQAIPDAAASDFTPLEAPGRPGDLPSGASTIPGTNAHDTAFHSTVSGAPVQKEASPRAGRSRILLLLLLVVVVVVVLAAAYLALSAR